MAHSYHNRQIQTDQMSENVKVTKSVNVYNVNKSVHENMMITAYTLQ